MKPSLCVADSRKEFKPHGRSRGEKNRTQRISTTGNAELPTQRTIKYLQPIIPRFRVKIIEHQFNVVPTGHRDFPRTSLVRRIIVGVPTTCKAARETPMLGQGASCKNRYLASKDATCVASVSRQILAAWELGRAQNVRGGGGVGD